MCHHCDYSKVFCRDLSSILHFSGLRWTMGLTATSRPTRGGISFTVHRGMNSSNYTTNSLQLATHMPTISFFLCVSHPADYMTCLWDLLGCPMSYRVSSMSVLPPVRKDRIIAELPKVRHYYYYYITCMLQGFTNPYSDTFIARLQRRLFVLSSVTVKTLLCTPRMSSPRKWGRHVRSNAPGLWGDY